GHVVRGEPVEGGDRARARREVALEERHLLRAARRPARMEDERDVAGIGRLEPGRRPGGELAAVDVEEAQPLDRPARGPGLARGGEDEPRREVLEVEAEL